jgi:hypothetical protein
MRRIVRAFISALALASGSAAFAAGEGGSFALSATGTCSVNAATPTAAVLYVGGGSTAYPSSLGGATTVGLDVSGTFVATVTVQGSIDGVNFFNLPIYGYATGISATGTTTAARFRVYAAGLQYVCAVLTAYTSGTVNLAFEPSAGPHLAQLTASDAQNLVELRVGRSANVNSATASNLALLVGSPAFWSVTHAPASATQATASKAALASTRHIAKSVHICLSAVAAQAALTINLRDGATGAGTVLATWYIAGAAGTSSCIDTTDLNILGTTNTAMTLESSAAPAATNSVTVTLTGISAS